MVSIIWDIFQWRLKLECDSSCSCTVAWKINGSVNNELIVCKNIEYRVIRIIFDLPDNILPESDYETDLKGCSYFEHLRRGEIIFLSKIF